MTGPPKLRIVSVEGSPSESERAAIETALEKMAAAEQQARSGSLWLRSARAHGRRLGMYDYRDRFDPADAWRLSVRFAAGGREYPGLVGRGDSR